MFAIRHKEHKNYLKIICCHPEFSDSYELGFSPAIEINFYVNESLGFISSILLGESKGYSYEPVIQSHINPHELEVIDLTDLSIVPLSDILDGQEVDELPPYQEPKNDNEIEIIRR